MKNNLLSFIWFVVCNCHTTVTHRQCMQLSLGQLVHDLVTYLINLVSCKRVVCCSLYLRRSWVTLVHVQRRNYTGVARKRLYSLFKQKLYKIKSGIRRISRRDAEWLVAFMRDRCAQNVSKCKFYVSFSIIWVSTTVGLSRFIFETKNSLDLCLVVAFPFPV